MKKKIKLKEKFAPVSGWNADVVLLVGPWELLKPWIQKNVTSGRKEEILKHIENKENTPAHTNLGRTYFLSGGGSLIWMQDYAAEVLVHEITHAAHHLLRSKATPLSDDTEEAYAYLMEHLFKCLYFQP